MKGNLTQRTDTGRINTSPVSATSPIIQLQHGCNHTIEIPGVHCVSEHIKVWLHSPIEWFPYTVEDVDGDDIRCRWAESNLGECSSVCQVFPATLNEVINHQTLVIKENSKMGSHTSS